MHGGGLNINLKRKVEKYLSLRKANKRRYLLKCANTSVFS